MEKGCIFARHLKTIKLKIMFTKKTTKSWLCLLAAGILALALTGFNTPTKPKKLALYVERQQHVLQRSLGINPNEDFNIGITIDVPVGGNPALVDSVTRLLNQTLYGFFDDRIDRRFKPEEVYYNDAKTLVDHYREAYKAYICDTCSMYEEPFCVSEFHYLRVTLVEQTKSFVTYEVSRYFIGEGDCEYLTWVTFYTSDGHRLQKIINDDQVVDLLRHTYGTEYDVTADVEYRLEMGSEARYWCDFGLTRDSLLCQYFYCPGIVDDMAFDMKTARPYLTEEARRLLE